MDLFDALSGAPLYAILAVLALVDSTSFGTLAIPVWLLMAPGRIRAGRVLTYLATIAAFYLVIGLAVLAGAGWIAENVAGLGALSGSRPVMVLGTVVGIGLFAWSFRLDSPAARERARSGQGRLARWRRAATGAEPDAGPDAGPGGVTGGGPGRGAGALISLALTAGLVEVASMLPYLAAIGLITVQGPGWPASPLMLVGYCLVMVLPALVLLAARVVARPLVERPLERLDAWFSRHSASAAAWVVGIIGVVLVVNTAPVAFADSAVSGVLPW